MLLLPKQLVAPPAPPPKRSHAYYVFGRSDFPQAVFFHLECPHPILTIKTLDMCGVGIVTTRK